MCYKCTDYNNLNISELKDLLWKLKLNVSKRKSELIAQLKEAKEKELTPETIAAALSADSNAKKIY